MENTPMEIKEGDIQEKIEVSPIAFKTTENTEKLDKKYNPAKLFVGEFFVPNTPSWHPVRGDITARIIVKCQDEGRFVAVSYWDLSKQIDSEVRELKDQEKEYDAEWDKRHSLMGLIRKMLSGVFGKKEDIKVDESREPRETKIIFSAIVRESEKDHYILSREVGSMSGEGLINILQQGKEQYLEPTEKLITEILEAQKKTK